MAALSILHVDTEPTWRGGQEALFSLVEELRRRGHSQRIACPARSPLAHAALEVGIPLTPLGASREIRQTLLREKVSIVHAHTGRGQNLAFLASLNLGVKRIVTRHVAFPPRHPGIHRWKYTLTCDGIIAVSHAVRQVLMDTGVPAAKIEVIRTGIAVPESVPDIQRKQEARKHFGLNQDAFVAGQLGAFTAEKGQDVSIAAWKQLSLPGAELILGGDGPTRKHLQSEAASSILFPGFIEDRNLFYSTLDVLLMPSRSEAWGLAALEAMANGVPVIASNIGGLPEMIEDRMTGILVPASDAAALAEAIRWVATSRESAQAMGSRAREAARSFSTANTATQTEAFYRRILAG